MKGWIRVDKKEVDKKEVEMLAIKLIRGYLINYGDER